MISDPYRDRILVVAKANRAQTLALNPWLAASQREILCVLDVNACAGVPTAGGVFDQLTRLEDNVSGSTVNLPREGKTPELSLVDTARGSEFL